MRQKKTTVKRFLAFVVLALLVISGCTGDSGSTGATGPAGPAGSSGSAAQDKGSITGTVKDASNNPIADATVTTSPATSSVQTDGSGGFTLSNISIGVYSVQASKNGYDVYALTGVGVTAGGNTLVNLALTVSSTAPGTIAGTVKNTAGTAIANATVAAEGQAGVSTTTAFDGSFTLTGVTPGFVYLSITPSDTSYLAGETREALSLPAGGMVTGVTATLSSRPTNSATFVGGAVCTPCHATIAADENTSAHYHSITADTSRMVNTTMTSIWPAIGGTVVSGVTATSPLGDGTSVAVSFCQNSAGVYSLKFGGTAADCTVADGTIIPVSGTYGGEGDGGIDNVPNIGKFKQRFLAKLADVAAATSWAYNTPADKGRDFLILPVQITQSGDGAPKLGAYHGNDWTSQGRTFSRACSGCHNTGLSITWDAGTTMITSYDYLDLNITCEKCHGPGSEHVAAGGGKAESIINTTYLTADAERQVCGQCHAADAGKSLVPSGSFGFAYNSDNAATLGGGTYVPGVYNVADYIKGFGVTASNGGGFDAWSDGQHGKAHRQQFPELAASKHANNPYEKLTCSSCHNTHTLVQGPAVFSAASGTNTYVFTAPTFKNNVLCMGCHATYGPYADLTKDDVAAIHTDAGGTVTKNGSTMTFTAAQISAAKGKIAASVGSHMQAEVGMGVAAYNPLNEASPVGRCQSCHMPKTGKSGGYTTGVDATGASALVEGDQGSHKFDIIWPDQSAALKKLTGGADTDIMPNSCGKCHAGARISGD